MSVDDRIRACPDCGRRFTSAEMAAEAIADLERRMIELSEQMRTDATFGRMTGLGDERSMDRLEVVAMWLHDTDGSDYGTDGGIEPWTVERCWPCVQRAETGD